MATKKGSYWARWYRARRKQGLCYRCSGNALKGSPFCLKHRIARQKQARKVGGFKPWRPGGPGRPPMNHSSK